MSTIDFSKIVASSKFSGFSNYKSASFSVSIAAQALGAGNFISFTASTPLNNTNAVSEAQLQYTGLETFWRYVPGKTILRYPNYSTPDFEVGSIVYFSGGILNVFTYIANEAGISVNVPAFTINIRAFLFLAPFN